jgi:hypothetical protein
MNTPRALTNNDAMQSYWEETATTHAILLVHPLTKVLAQPWTLLLEEINECSQNQRTCWLQELTARASCSQTNYRLGLLVEEFQNAKVNELRAKNKGWKDKEAHSSPEFVLYFGTLRPFELIRLGLESQLSIIESWPHKISLETSAELQSYGAKFQWLLEEGKQAAKTRSEARAKTALHRLKEIHSLVGKLNKQRLATYTELLQLAQQQGEVKSWPGTFFIKTARPSTPRRIETTTQPQA